MFVIALSINTSPEGLNVVGVDGAPAHTAKKLVVPGNVVLLRLRPYCPERNPAERLWLDVKRRIDVRVQSVRALPTPTEEASAA